MPKVPLELELFNGLIVGPGADSGVGLGVHSLLCKFQLVEISAGQILE